MLAKCYHGPPPKCKSINPNHLLTGQPKITGTHCLTPKFHSSAIPTCIDKWYILPFETLVFSCSSCMGCDGSNIFYRGCPLGEHVPLWATAESKWKFYTEPSTVGVSFLTNNIHGATAPLPRVSLCASLSSVTRSLPLF